MTPRTRFKVCCMASREEADLAIAAGATAIGLVAAMPSGPGPIPDALIREIAEHTAGRVRRFLLTPKVLAAEIATQVRAAGVDTVQLVDAVAQEELARLRDALPDTQLVQVIHVRDASDVEAAVEVAEFVDEILLDSGNPSARIKELGGTGRTHDWTLSRRIVEASPVPVWLAGGLRPENAADAVRSVRPYGLDICSGLRPAGALDPDRLRAFAEALAAA
ncbi:MAG: phosphoribosylanthranilate isomerase [Gemmatimonadaceae bacterium]|nr:phosphoribosylanthranilate isomerase [Gemmatimonadaceae bacterium]